MIISGLLDIIFLLLKVLITPIGAALNVPGVTNALEVIWPTIDSFLDMISSGFGLAAYFFHWDLIKVMIGCVLLVDTALHTYKIVMWIYNKIPMIH